MNASRSCRAAAVLLLAVPASVAAQSADNQLPSPERYSLRAEYRFFTPSLTGEVQKGTAEQAGTLLDVNKDLGIEDRRTHHVRGTFQIRPGHKLRGSWTRLTYDGDVPEARRNFIFDDTRFDRFSHVVTTVRGNFFTAEYEWDFLKGPRGYLGVLLGAKAVDVDWVIVSPEDSRRETDTLRAPVPSLGAATRLYAGRLSFEGELSGLTLGDRGTMYEAQFSVRLHIADRMAVQGGYRFLKIKGSEAQDLGDLRLSGFDFGMELSL